MSNVRSTEGQPHRVGSDLPFFVLLGTIGGTYVVLIVAMLLADAVYAFRAESMTSSVITFSLDDYDGQSVTDQFVTRYGMTVACRDASRHAAIIDSSRPPDGLAAFGAPHGDFSGPGVGEGGKRSAIGRNARRLGNVITVGSRDAAADSRGGTLVFTWDEPLVVAEAHLLNIGQPGGRLTTFDADGEEVSSQSLRALGKNSFQVVPVDDVDVSRMEITFPEGGGAVAELRITWVGRVRSDWERRHPVLAKIVFNPVIAAFGKPEIRYSVKLSMISCTLTAILSLWVAVPIGYLLSRYEFRGKNLADAILDIPIVLPPLVVGLSLLILFQAAPIWLKERVVYQIPAVILAQFMVACAFAVRTMRATFDQIDARREDVALTLGCSRFQAFGMIVIPEAKRGILTAGTLAWARALGEFGPLLIFAGATRNKTEVLSTTVFLELSIGDLSAAVAVSLIMVFAAMIVLILARLWGTRS